MVKSKVYSNASKTLHNGINSIPFKSELKLTGGFFVADGEFCANYECTPINIHIDTNAIFVKIEPPVNEVNRLRPSKIVPYGTYMGYVYDSK